MISAGINSTADMWPVFAVNDAIYVTGGYPEFPRNFALSFTRFYPLYDSHNEIISQGGFTVPLTKWASIFGDFILDILSLGSEKKVIRSDAFIVVALVKNAKPVWNKPKVEKPGCPIGANHSSSFWPLVNLSVTLPWGRNPVPTGFGFVDLLPESFRECFGKPLRLEEFVRNVVLHSKRFFYCVAPSVTRITRWYFSFNGFAGDLKGQKP